MIGVWFVKDWLVEALVRQRSDVLVKIFLTDRGPQPYIVRVSWVFYIFSVTYVSCGIVRLVALFILFSR